MITGFFFRINRDYFAIQTVCNLFQPRNTISYFLAVWSKFDFRQMEIKHPHHF